MATRIRIKRGTESQITGYTGTHYEGELAYATNTGNVFVNDGTAFISIGGGETPTLQSVTDEGNTTTNAISVGTITANNELHLVNSAMRIFRSGDDMRIRTNNSDRITITSNGNVGIGTTSPTQKLDVNGDISIPLGENIRWGSQLGIRKESNGELNFFAGTNSTNGGFNFRGWNGSAYESGTVVIRNNGNVGIGTTAPDSKLHIQGSFGNNTFKVKPNADHTIIEAGQEFRIGTTNSGDIKFQPGGVIGMFISGTSRNVGIGTTSPSGHLHVIDSGNFSNGGVFIQNTGTTSATLGLENTEGKSRLFTNNGVTTLRNTRTGFSNYSIDIGGRGVKIKEGNGGQNADASAILDLDSTTQGVLFPRMTELQKDSISSPATGLIIYQTDAQEGLYIYKSSGWAQII